ncbi:hypothetical protein [Aureimonas jatrophae]|uniref:Uncharacterized protein n=1 Tax=Aureimonas jatrophae TaxID=1166073 RepID=A0A1H0M6M2_9HYPH|nr:hypothetical protein [Aureimonas jatrophae]MBB3952604.1 hypothetical protein [Aureimonas jatrophae]SDO75931.1 hypothetical protein SAMN05192530_11287 [Aureimonas jatrophae]
MQFLPILNNQHGLCRFIGHDWQEITSRETSVVGPVWICDRCRLPVAKGYGVDEKPPRFERAIF